MKCCRLVCNGDKSTMFMYGTLFVSVVFFICFVVYVFVLVDKASELKTPLTREKILIKEFVAYLNRFAKKYPKEELKQRFENFKNSINEIDYLNRPYKDGTRYGLTKYSDMSPEEFASAFLVGYIEPGCKEQDKNCFDQNRTNKYEEDKLKIKRCQNRKKCKEDRLPLIFDWRDYGVVGPVLNQRTYCLNSWAFTVIGIMESMLRISKKNNAYTRLSVQELTDCSTYTHKCVDSSLVAAVNFICDKKWPIVPASEYPMTPKAVSQNCSVGRPTAGALINKFQVKCDVGPQEIASIIVKHGPVAAAVNARPWRHYREGIIQYHCSGLWEHTNHVVQIVGYDVTMRTPYFIVRNSWGPRFGDQGYVHVAMDNFVCGIGRQITFFDATLI